MTAPGHHRLLLLVQSILLLSCGSSKPEVRWQDSMQDWFSNTSVPLEPPRALWTREDEVLFQRRIGYADVASVGTIRVVNLSSVHDSDQQVSLAFRPVEMLYGSLADQLDDDKQIYLTLGPSDEDFQRALSAQRHLPGTRYLILVKWKPAKGDERVQTRWALYRADKQLLAEARAMYSWLKKKRSN
jgi:hypothetical protein